ncbi:MAG: sterol desaturase family protein [Candidatus Marinimicrobia bacterium]|jgi:sterol desaturase/sphingolipid hydroxylase (fatty acid hydroxylase superfamily)|nr:sterol desaturase family protein [Candidatus Neomarinimicrobiota bacterium]MBT3676023.1 sterol desaturase family protein [Candidatus Neomarinimicrobiota bacterium]MBT4068608.1 sterol desaturase family protein [Candidatus Neomarinimicrobiota bacterium]MBT4271706.1 sterol desaturase family protein [Candidatus Neomarinimicrobiota bacterium]MBT4371934.1 sterol desaturase family protein [Candidatus Neomarinimicrobiota bacterium]
MDLTLITSGTVLLLIAAVIHFMENQKPLEAIKRLSNIKFDITVIVISTMFVFFIMDYLLNETIVSNIHMVVGLGNSVGSMPPWLRLILALIIGDFGYYIFHRIMHLKPMWNTHRFHHSIKDIYWFSGLRTSFLNSFIIRIPYLVGFQMFEVPYRELIIASILLILVNFWIHGNLKLKMDSVLSNIIITPRFHRLHHVNDERVAGNNFGNIFSVWDQLFGTAIFDESFDRSEKGEVVEWKEVPRQIIGF